MLIIDNIIKILLKKYTKKTSNLIEKQISNTLKNYREYYAFIINNKSIEYLLLNNDKQDKEEKNNLKDIAKLLENTIRNNFIKDKINFLNIIVFKLNNINKCECYLPENLNSQTENNIITFLQKDNNIKKIKIIKKKIEELNINNIVYVIIKDRIIRYSIYNFLIKIIQKELVFNE